METINTDEGRVYRPFIGVEKMRETVKIHKEKLKEATKLSLNEINK